MATKSTGYAAQLLRALTDRQQKNERVSDQTQDKVPGLVTLSYNNIYDQLNDKFSNSLNYNEQTFHDALINGELGLYLNLLSKNPDTQVGDSKFYDPQYYNYNAQIAELALSSGEIDNEELVSRDIWDNDLGDYVKQDMTEYDYNRYQLNEYYNNRSLQINRAIEEYRKSQMSDFQKFMNSVGAVGLEFLEGGARFIANIADLALSPFVAGIDAMASGKSYADAFTDWFANGLSAAEQDVIRTALNEYERLNTSLMDINGNYQGIGRYAVGIANSVGYMLPSMVLGAVTGGGALWFGAGILGRNLFDNLTNDDLANVPFGVKIANAAIKAVAETAIEWGLSKLLGPTFEDTLKNLKPSASKLSGAVSKTATKLTKEALTKRGVKALFTDALQEGLEEFLQDGTNGLIDAFMDLQWEGFGNEGINFQTLMDSFLMGSLTSFVLAGLGTPLHSRANPIYVDDGKGNYKRLGGFSYRGMSEILADYKSAAEAVRDGKIRGQQAVDVATDIYKIATQLTPFFSSLSTERMANAEKLLQRVQENADKDATSLFEGDTVSEVGKFTVVGDEDVKAAFKTGSTTSQYFGQHMLDTLMTAIDANIKGADAAKKAKKKKAEKVLDDNKKRLEENGVTEAKEFVTKETVDEKKKAKKEKSEAVKEAEKILNPKYEDLLEQYEGIVITDGHIAVDGDGILFVSQAWLENYTTDVIYKFLAQQRVFDTLSSTAEFMGINSAMTEHYRQFSGKANATTEEALMNTLFNQTVYEHFLLTGDNAHKYKDYAFRLHEIIATLTNKGNLTAEQKALIEQVYEQIKEVMRIPVLKAILNWNMEPQKIGADSVLTKTDKDLIVQYQVRKNVINGTTKAGDFRHISSSILNDAKISMEERQKISQGLQSSDMNERLLARRKLALLDMYNSGVRTETAIVAPLSTYDMNLTRAQNQLFNDALQNFVNEYGFDPSNYIPTKPQGKLKADMQLYQMTDVGLFITVTIENQLDDNLIVTISDDKVVCLEKIHADEWKLYNSTQDVLNIIGSGSATLADLFDINKIPQFLREKIQQDNVPVVFADLSNIPNALGLYKDNKIYISKDYVNKLKANPDSIFDFNNTLVHEFNHYIQDKFRLPNGIDINTFLKNTRMIKEFVRNNRELTRFMLDNASTLGKKINFADTDIDALLDVNTNKFKKLKNKEMSDIVTDDKLYEIQQNYDVYNFIATMMYILWNGELLASSSFDINTKGIDRIGRSYTKNKFSTQLSADPYANYNNEERAFLEVMDKFADYEYNALRDKNTFHTKFNSNTTSKQILDKLIRQNLPWQIAAKLTLNDIITQAEMFLSNDLLATIDGEITEGKIAQAVKHYIEDNFKGISIDRNAITHDYVLVNDNAFDDFLLPNILDKATDDENDDIVKKFTSGDGINLNQFYSTLQLSRLGLPSNIKIIANDKVSGTQTVRDKQHPNGAIFVKTDSLMTNAEFVDKVNHEFRHLMQLYNKLETGFTINFKVTQDMIADMKKHLPNLFKDKDVRAAFKTDESIVQHYIYHLNGGELEGYGFDIAQKPSYVEEKGGQPTIYMPWYNAKTGEGRYQTEYISNRALDKNEQEDVKKALQERKAKNFEKLKVDKKPRTKQIITPEGVVKYQSNLKRNFTRKEAANDNRKYFLREGVPPQMDPDLQEFIIKTTGHLNELPQELKFAIKAGQLNKKQLFQWFRTIDPKLVNEFTFNLMNEVFFHNDKIKSMDELMAIVDDTDAMIDYNILFHTLLEENIDEELVTIQNDLSKVKELCERMKLVPKFAEKIEARRKRVLQPGKGRKDFAVTPKMEQAMRMAVMRYFDGSLAGAAYSANILFNLVYRKDKHYQEGEGEISLNATSNKNGAKKARDGEGSEFGDLLSINDISNVGMSTKSYNIMELYNDFVADVDVDTMLETVINYVKETKGAEFAQKLLKAYMKDGSFNNELYDKLSEQYSKALFSQMTGYRVGSMQPIGSVKTNRERIVKNAKRFATQIIQRVAPANWKNLPQNIQDMFEEVNGKKKLKSEVYSVGRGRVKGKPGPRDTQQIFENMQLLQQAATDAKNGVFLNREVSKKIEKTQERLDKEIKKTRELNKKLNEHAPQKKVVIKVTDKKNRAINEKNEFTIVSSKPMPNVLKDIYDTSFNKLADDKVQFLSKDKDGKLYEKNTKEWESAVQHEVTSYTAFYEKNAVALAELTRNDIIDIVNYIVSSPTTIDGPNFKLDAFNIFMMAYIVDGARRNFNDWDFSDTEIARFEEIARKQRSLAGSLLNATAQTMHLVNPIKIISSRALDKYDISQDQQDDLFDAIDELINAKTLDKQKEKATEVNKQLAEIEDEMLEYRNKQKGWTKNIWQKIKSWRYTSMLSSPVTWVRNLVSNVVNFILNAAADGVSRFIFRNKGYREGQWNLNDIQVSGEVRGFIENAVLNSDLFNMLYDGTPKFDDRGRLKKAVEAKDLFRSMIINAVEREFAAGHKFDSTALNNWSKFVDKMISDKAFIKKAATRYLGKILQIKLDNGEVRLDQGLSNEVLNSFADAVVIAQAEYMRKRSPLANVIDSLRKSSPVTAGILQWWQPFINSSFNWFTEIFKYTPMGLGYSIIQSARLENKIQKMDAARARGELAIDSRAAQYLARKDIGKGVVGLLLIAIGSLLGAFGIVKIDEDDDKFYMSIGDVKIDISRIFGSSSVLIGVALMQDRDTMTTLRDMSEILFQDLFIADMIKAGKYNQTFFDYMLNQTENVAKSFVPQIIQLTVRATNNQQIKYSSGIQGAFERYVNSFFPTQPMGSRVIDPYTGEPKTKYSLPFLGEFLKSGILGAQIYFKPVTDTELELANLGIRKGEIEGQLTQDGNTYKIDKQATNEYYGKLNAKSLPKLKTQKHQVRNDDGKTVTLAWNKMTDEQKASVIERTMALNAKYAKIYQWTKEGHKYYASDSIYQELKKLGITSNVYRGDKGFVE